MPERPGWMRRPGRHSGGTRPGSAGAGARRVAGSGGPSGPAPTSYAPGGRHPRRAGQAARGEPGTGGRFGLPWRRLALGAATVMSVIALGWGAAWLLEGDTLRVQRVTVIGAQVEGPRTVAQAADLDGRSLLTLDLTGAAERVRALPGVSEATVERDWPNGALVRVVERQGWGYWQAAGQRVVIDADGRVLDRARPPHRGAVTVIEVAADAPLRPGDRVDADTVGLLDRIARDGVFDRLRVTPERFEFRSDRGLTIRIADGPDAVFGDSQSFDFKVAAWGSLLERMEQQYLEAEEIDLRFGQQLVLR